MIPRYETAEIKSIWTDQNRFQRWLDVELAACRAWNEVGVIPDEDMKNIVDNAGFSVERIREIEAVIGGLESDPASVYDIFIFLFSGSGCRR